jgi:MoxR-like ATPase
LLLGGDRRQLLREMQPVLTAQSLGELPVEQVPTVLAFDCADGLPSGFAGAEPDSSMAADCPPRAGLALLRASQAWAMMAGQRNWYCRRNVQAVRVFMSWAIDWDRKWDAVRGGGTRLTPRTLSCARVPVKL